MNTYLIFVIASLATAIILTNIRITWLRRDIETIAKQVAKLENKHDGKTD